MNMDKVHAHDTSNIVIEWSRATTTGTQDSNQSFGPVRIWCYGGGLLFVDADLFHDRFDL